MSEQLVFKFLLEDILGILRDYAGTTAANMAAVIGPVALILFGVYIMLWGAALAQGKIQSPATDGFLRIVRGVLIIGFATSSGIFAEFVIDFFWTVPGLLASEVTVSGASATLGNTPEGSAAIANVLDTALGKGLAAAGVAWEEAGRAGMGDMGAAVGFTFVAIAIAVLVALVCVYAGALVLVSSMGLALMLGVGPIFILLAMFEATQSFFQAWVRQVTTFAIFYVLLASAVSLMFSFFMPFLDGIAEMNWNSVILAFVRTFVMCGVGLVILYQVQGWAAGLAGGIAIGAVGAVSQAIGAARKGTNTALGERRFNPATGKMERMGGMAREGAAGVKWGYDKSKKVIGSVAKYLRRNRIQQI